mmetsp:Transcript_20108/g.56528  ORF Transcript_20108/g.56528 Transcript_20108/m.56528 type:complete len:219 (-) Transcript_20108:298-954(-)
MLVRTRTMLTPHPLAAGRLHLGGVAGEDAVADGGRRVPEGAGAVGQEDGLVGPRVRPHVVQHVEVLRHEHHVQHVAGGHLLRGLVLLEELDALGQPLHDGLPLPAHAQPREVLAVAVGLRRLDDADFVGLGLLHGGHAQALGGVDLVHGLLHARVGVDVRHQRGQHHVAVFGEAGGEALLDGFRDALLLLEHHVKLHGGHLGPQHGGHVAADLRLGVV